jgi:hypothetical protein
MFALLAMLIVASILLAACGGPKFECTDAIGCVDIAPDEPVKIAYMLTISGATAYLGQDSQGAIEIAIDDRGGELLGHPISLSGEDSLCSAEGGQTAHQASFGPHTFGCDWFELFERGNRCHADHQWCRSGYAFTVQHGSRFNHRG